MGPLREHDVYICLHLELWAGTRYNGAMTVLEWDGCLGRGGCRQLGHMGQAEGAYCGAAAALAKEHRGARPARAV